MHWQVTTYYLISEKPKQGLLTDGELDQYTRLSEMHYYTIRKDTDCLFEFDGWITPSLNLYSHAL